ncbi:MAG: hypothetical protein JO127_02805 [Caulobacteraceae bacterium]|nr:hypothetical protein [Caulobacteraceae bacterium]
MTPTAILAAALLASAAAPPDNAGEPLPPTAPRVDYQLTAWCYGALKEYLDIYEQVKPELVDIDKMFGTSVKEAEPYQSDMAAARVELKMIANAVTLAQKASPRPINEESTTAMRQGAAIWSVAETKSRRELARAWLTWALPDRCDSVAREVAAKSALFSGALKYNDPPAPPAAAEAPAPAPPPPPEAATPAAPPPATSADQPAPDAAASGAPSAKP